MTVVVSGSNITFNDSSVQDTAATGFGFKNRIINGAMVIDQRNAGAEVNPAVSGGYYTDRWNVLATQTSKFKIGQNAGAVTLPAGFIKYLGITSLSAYSVTASDVFEIRQNIEGLNFADMAWGTASASAVTVSFRVYSSLTGTFGGALQNTAYTRSYPFSYSIPVANTWTTISVTIAGDTTGTWLTTNDTGVRVVFGLGVGSTYSGTAGAWAATEYHSATGATSVVGTSGATFYITGVQLEKGSTATSFDYRPYGTELALCQRYAISTVGSTSQGGLADSTTTAQQRFVFPVEMRASPTVSITTSGSWVISNDHASDFTASTVTTASITSSSQAARVKLGGFTGLVTTTFYAGVPGQGTSKLVFSSEL